MHPEDTGCCSGGCGCSQKSYDPFPPLDKPMTEWLVNRIIDGLATERVTGDCLIMQEDGSAIYVDTEDQCFYRIEVRRVTL